MAKRLTQAMWAALVGVIRDVGTAPGNSATRKALIRRGLLDESMALTAKGRIQALQLLPLVKQCRYMDLPLATLGGWDGQSRPEPVALHHFQKQGFVGAYCEGGAILLLIRSAALDLLERLNPQGSAGDARTRYTEAQLTILQAHVPAIRASIAQASSEEVGERFQKIYADPGTRERNPALDAATMEALFQGIRADNLARLAGVIAEAPYTYRKGWPDLTLARDEEVRWVEVKTTDTLLESQLRTISRMRPALPGQVAVVQMQQGQANPD